MNEMDVKARWSIVLLRVPAWELPQVLLVASADAAEGTLVGLEAYQTKKQGDPVPWEARVAEVEERYKVPVPSPIN
jgi:hypothetical protein